MQKKRLIKVGIWFVFLIFAIAAGILGGEGVGPSWRPGSRVLLDSHNCYPELGSWVNRIDRALGTGPPIAIEQDLVWYRTGKVARSIISHGEPFNGSEPSLQNHFFERIRPFVEQALNGGDTAQWPLFTLNLDFKTKEPEHLTAVWTLLGDYAEWLCSAEKSYAESDVAQLEIRPVLVLCGDSDEEQKAFYDSVPVGQALRVFGAVKVEVKSHLIAPEQMVKRRAGNYRRWWNNPWEVVEDGGQSSAGLWTDDEKRRLEALVSHAHSLGLWIRFYTLNGHSEEVGERNGWNRSYNFGSLDRVRLRWSSAILAGVDFLATDQYEDLSAELNLGY